MKLMKTLIFALGVISLAACEPGSGSADAESTTGSTDNTDDTDSTDNTETTDITDDTDDTGGTVTQWGAIEIIDDADNSTLADCDQGSPGSIRSPGADIDGAVLADANGTVKATLGGCKWIDQPTCTGDENSNEDLAGLQGNVTQLKNGVDLTDPSDRQDKFDPAETDSGQYLALGGGSVQCNFVDAAGAQVMMTSTDVLWVFEVGGSSSTTVESYSIRLCDMLDGMCQYDKAFGSGVTSTPVASFLE